MADRVDDTATTYYVRWAARAFLIAFGLFWLVVNWEAVLAVGSVVAVGWVFYRLLKAAGWIRG